MNFEREMMRHDLKAKSQIARSFDLRPVELPVKQSSLFTPTFEPDDLPEPCRFAEGPDCECSCSGANHGRNW